MRIGSDTGGTFTDLVAEDGSITKVPSTPDDPGRAIGVGLERLVTGRRPEVLAHGTTVGTNALLERRGATVALVTNEGFADVIEIGRQDRPSLYDQTADRPEPLVAREHRLEVRGRLDADGHELEPLDLATLAPIAEEVEAVAVRPAARRPRRQPRAGGGRGAASPGGSTSPRRTRCRPEFREYERTVTTVVNAYLRPVCRPYLRARCPTAPTRSSS